MPTHLQAVFSAALVVLLSVCSPVQAQYTSITPALAPITSLYATAATTAVFDSTAAVDYQLGISTTATPGSYVIQLLPSNITTIKYAIVHYDLTGNNVGQQNVYAFTYQGTYAYPLELLPGDLLSWSFTIADARGVQIDTRLLTIQTAASAPTPTTLAPAPSTAAATTIAATVPLTSAAATTKLATTKAPTPTVVPTSTAAPTTTAAPSTTAVPTITAAPITTVAATTSIPTTTAAPVTTKAATTAAPTTPPSSATTKPVTPTPIITSASTAVPTVPATSPPAPLVNSLPIAAPQVPGDTVVTYLSNNYISTANSNVDTTVATREAFLSKRLATVLAAAGNTMNATAWMIANSAYASEWNDNFISANTLGGIDPNSQAALARLGSNLALQLVVSYNLTNLLPAAITFAQQDIATRIMQFRLWVAAGNNPNNDINQRVERGGILYSAWLLHQVGAYMVAAPFAAPINSTQQLVENFTVDYVETLNVSPGITWTTTGYNKEISQGLHPAFMLAIYNDTVFQRMFPLTFTGFYSFWDAMFLGAKGTYEPDNTPSYGNLNVFFILSMSMALNRNVRPVNSTDPHAFLTDSWDMPRVFDRLYHETMSTGNAVNYNKAISTWGQPATNYSFNYAEGSAPMNLRMAYAIYGNSSYLYMSRKITQQQITTKNLATNALYNTEIYGGAKWQFDNVTNVYPDPNSPTSVVTQMLTSASCYSQLLLCRGAPQSKAYQTPSKIVLRTGFSDSSGYVMMSLAGAGQHSNPQQRMTLENTLYNNSYLLARPGRPQQANQANQIFVCRVNYTYPLTDAYLAANNLTFDAALGYTSSLGTQYNLSSAKAAQITPTTAYGDVTYAQYQYVGVSAKRQVIMLSNGIIAVRDTVFNNGTIPVQAGVLWNLWPGIQQQGTNWAVQASTYGITNLNVLPYTQNNTALVYVVPGSHSFGSNSVPLSTWLPRTTTAQTVTKFYAVDTLPPKQTSTFISLIIPLTTPSVAAGIASAITTVATAANQTLVSLPFGQQSNILVNWDAAEGIAMAQ